jgi:hypothetical protein
MYQLAGNKRGMMTAACRNWQMLLSSLQETVLQEVLGLAAAAMCKYVTFMCFINPHSVYRSLFAAAVASAAAHLTQWQACTAEWAVQHGAAFNCGGHHTTAAATEAPAAAQQVRLLRKHVHNVMLQTHLRQTGCCKCNLNAEIG